MNLNQNGEKETECGHHAVAENCGTTGVNEDWEHYRASRNRDGQAFLLTRHHFCGGQQDSVSTIATWEGRDSQDRAPKQQPGIFTRADCATSTLGGEYLKKSFADAKI